VGEGGEVGKREINYTHTHTHTHTQTHLRVTHKAVHAYIYIYVYAWLYLYLYLSMICEVINTLFALSVVLILIPILKVQTNKRPFRN